MNTLRLPPMPTIGNLLKLYKVKALKKLSQNFLYEPRLIDKIVKAAGHIHNGLVCEVGPGPGGITRSILKRSPKYLLLVEKDERFRPMLEDLEDSVKNHCRLETKYSDIMGFDMEQYFDKNYQKKWDDFPPNIHIIGNLPFDISTYLITRWLRDISLRQNAWSLGRVKLTLTFQKEVAERIVAPILSKQRCKMSVICQNYCDVRHKFNISGKAFIPKPQVDVGVVTFVPLIRPVISYQFEVIEKVLRIVFNTRQKYIKFGIGNLFPPTLRDNLSKELFRKSEVDPTMRSFQLTTEEYGRLIAAYKEICDNEPSVYEYDYRGPKVKNLPQVNACPGNVIADLGEYSSEQSRPCINC